MYLISDNHFGHFNIIKHENRPFQNIDEMTEFMIQEWNSTVKPNDILLHAGDWSFRCGLKNMKVIFDRLNGRKILIRGNHDEKPRVYFEMGWEQVYDSYTLKWGGVFMTISHYPLNHPSSTKSLFDYGQHHIHGHVHSKLPIYNGRQVNVSAENLKYKPLHINYIVNHFKSLQG